MANAKELTAEQFICLVLKHEWRIKAFVATILGKPHDIEDVVQDVFAVAWSKRKQLRYSAGDPDEDFVRWVCTIGRYEALKVRRQRSKSGLVLDESIIERLVSFQLEESEYLEARRRALAKCIKRLKGVDQDLVRRRYSAGQSVEKMAEQEGKTISTIYKALNRIRISLMNCIGRSLHREGY